MIWGYVYIFLMLSAVGAVVWLGDWECRLAILTLLAGSTFTLIAVYFSGTYFEDATPLIIGFDFLILAVFVGHALVSRRYWMLPVASMQLITCGTHLAKVSAPAILPDAYSMGQGHWAYIQMAIILVATLYVRVGAKKEMKPR